MKDDVFTFSHFTFSTLSGLSDGKRMVHMPPRYRKILHTLLFAEGRTVDFVTLEGSYSKTASSSVKLSRLNLSQNILWLRRRLGDEDGLIIQTVLKQGYRLGVPVLKQTTSTAVDLPKQGERVEHIFTEQPTRGGRHSHQATGTRFTLSPANENLNLKLQSDLRPNVFSRNAIAGSVRPADYVDRLITSISADIKAFPADPHSLATLGWLKGAVKGDREEGTLHINQALESDPSLSLGHFYRTWLLIAEKRIDLAVHELKASLSAHPRNDDLLFLLIYSYCALGEHDAADALTSKALIYHPNNLLLRISRAIHLTQRCEFKRAETLLAQTTLMFPQSTLLIATIAWVNASRGDRSTAITYLTAKQKTANGFMSPIAIAAVYNALGDRASANAYLKFAEVDLDPWRGLVWCSPQFRMIESSAAYA